VVPVLGDSEQQFEDNGITGTAIANPQNIYNLAAERGPSSFDIKLLNVTSVLYDVPVGRGRKYFTQRQQRCDGPGDERGI
jgi:hypothetical protein